MESSVKPDNPWQMLDRRPPFVLTEDRPYVEAFNSIHGHDGDRRINLHYTPEPRLGPVTAPVVLLQLNPSYNKDEPYGPQSDQVTLHELENIRDESSAHPGVLPGDGWWNRTFRQLMGEPEVGPERVSRGICSVEFFPYRSLRFCHGAVRLPSQRYTFALVRERLARGALIIVTRAYPLWISAVPELVAGLNRTVFVTNNPRRTTISRGNLSAGVYEKICERLRDA